MSENKFNSVLQDKIDKEKKKEQKKNLFNKNKNYELDDQNHKDNVFVKSFRDFMDIASAMLSVFTVISCILVLVIVVLFVVTRLNPDLWYLVNETLKKIGDVALNSMDMLNEYVN